MFYLAPFRITITPLNDQQVGSPLMLDCSITDIDGNNISVEIVWISNNMILKRSNALPTVMDNRTVYTNSYTISQLTTNHQGRIYQCMVNRTNPAVVDSNDITLNVTGEVKSRTYSILCV